MRASEENVKSEGAVTLDGGSGVAQGRRALFSDCGFRASFGVRFADFGFSCLPLLALILLALGSSITPSRAELKFPPPEFESGYVMPKLQHPDARSLWLEYGDVLVLAVALGVASWAVHKRRSRKWVVGIGVFSLLYFGFYREGCACAIGSIQNVALGLFNSSYSVPLVVLAFFALPLITALFFGRTFCASVCPHGALQDLLLLKPIKVPGWLEHGLGVVPFVYLGLAVLFAATGSAFLICEYDPFIPLFRLSGSATSMAIAASFLIAGVFIGRPYCRFLCPYGALLKISSAFAKWRVRITPDICTQCTLCTESCPFGVIRQAHTASPPPRVVAAARRRLVWTVAALPLLIGGVAFAGHKFAAATAVVHPDVKLVQMYEQQQSGKPQSLQPKDTIALTRAEHSHKELVDRAGAVRERIEFSGWLAGGWIGLVIGIKLLGMASAKRRLEFEPERAGCFGCARCFESCSQERARRGLVRVSG